MPRSRVLYAAAVHDVAATVFDLEARTKCARKPGVCGAANFLHALVGIAFPERKLVARKKASEATARAMQHGY